jgi:hypothetical protein
MDAAKSVFSEINPAAWCDMLPPISARSLSSITGICQSCGRALFGSEGGWYDILGYENCPTPWPGTPFHEPIRSDS